MKKSPEIWLTEVAENQGNQYRGFYCENIGFGLVEVTAEWQRGAHIEKATVSFFDRPDLEPVEGLGEYKESILDIMLDFVPEDSSTEVDLGSMRIATSIVSRGIKEAITILREETREEYGYGIRGSIDWRKRARQPDLVYPPTA